MIFRAVDLIQACPPAVLVDEGTLGPCGQGIVRVNPLEFGRCVLHMVEFVDRVGGCTLCTPTIQLGLETHVRTLGRAG
jgi:hypothetical protein